MRVLYYTSVQLHELGNGGNICCRNNVARLSEEKDLEVFAVVTQEPRCEAGTKALMDALGVPFRFVPYQPTKKPKSFFERQQRSLLGQLRAPAGLWRRTRMTSTQVQAVLDEMIVKWEIDALVIDHYISAMHIKLPRYDVKTCIIKLNREAEFYADQLKYEKSAWYRWTHQLDLLRLIWLERKIDNSVGKVIAIGVPDIPKGKTQSPGTCITPYLDRMPVQWRYTDSRCVFFVGNISHYPNRLAIEWIATKLAPEMAQICPGIGIKIVGCTPQDVRASWQQPNVQFLGAMDRAYVKNLFCHADLMLCPIENDFGMKFKSAEAIAFGTPLLASIQTLRGLTYLTTPPAIDLNRPEAAATLVRDLLACKERLIELSAAQTRDYTAFVKTQKSIWTSTLDDTPPLSR